MIATNKLALFVDKNEVNNFVNENYLDKEILALSKKIDFKNLPYFIPEEFRANKLPDELFKKSIKYCIAFYKNDELYIIYFADNELFHIVSNAETCDLINIRFSYLFTTAYFEDLAKEKVAEYFTKAIKARYDKINK